MFESIKDRAISYPFLPVASATTRALAAKIRDLRLTIPISDTVTPGVGYRVYLTEITQTDAIFTYTKEFPDGSQPITGGTVSVPVSVGVDTASAYGNTYLIASEALTAQTLTTPIEVHPDCLMFLQTAPILSVQNRQNLTADDTPETQVTYQMSPTLVFTDGYNVSVSKTATGVLFTGIPGAGLGVHTAVTSPYVTTVPLDYKASVGLRSINGIENSVMFKGAVVQVSATGGTVTLTLQLPGAAQ